MLARTTTAPLHDGLSLLHFPFLLFGLFLVIILVLGFFVIVVFAILVFLSFPLPPLLTIATKVIVVLLLLRFLVPFTAVDLVVDVLVFRLPFLFLILLIFVAVVGILTVIVQSNGQRWLTRQALERVLAYQETLREPLGHVRLLHDVESIVAVASGGSVF